MRFSRFFIDRPIFAAVLSIVIFLAGAIAMVSRCRSASIPRSFRRRSWCAPSTRAPTRGPGRGGGDAAGGADQRRREHAVHVVAGDLGRRADADRDLPGRHRRRPRAGAGAEPRQPGAAPPAGRGAPARRHHGQELAQHHDGGAPRLARQPLRQRLPAQLRPAAGQGRPGPHAGRGPGAGLRRRRLRHAHLAGPEQGRGARPDRPATS